MSGLPAHWVADQLGLKGKELFQPIRAALTGMLHGPNMSEIESLLDRKLMISRLNVLFA